MCRYSFLELNFFLIVILKIKHAVFNVFELHVNARVCYWLKQKSDGGLKMHNQKALPPFVDLPLIVTVFFTSSCPEVLFKYGKF